MKPRRTLSANSKVNSIRILTTFLTFFCFQFVLDIILNDNDEKADKGRSMSANISEMLRTSTPTQPGNAQVPQVLSAEALQILSELPKLSFMRAKVLMFPLKSTLDDEQEDDVGGGQTMTQWWWSSKSQQHTFSILFSILLCKHTFHPTNNWQTYKSYYVQLNICSYFIFTSSCSLIAEREKKNSIFALLYRHLKPTWDHRVVGSLGAC